MVKKLQWVLGLPYKLFRYTLIPKYLFLKQSKRRNTSLEKELIKKLGRYKIKWKKDNPKVVLTQIMEDQAMCIRLAAATHYLAEKHSANIGLYSVYTKLEDNVYRSNSFWDRIGTEGYYKSLTDLFLSFGGKVLLRNVFDYKDKKAVAQLYREIKSKIRKKDDILNIRIENIHVGDLIYDTFLRYGKTWTVDVENLFLDKIIIEALNIYFNCKELCSRYEIKGLVNTYTTYIHHGIIVRVCLERNIPVYTIGSNNSLLHRVLKEYPSHSNDHFNFPDIFKKLNCREDILRSTKEIFEKRFQGEIDKATSFMKESSYSSYTNKEIIDCDWPNTVVIMAHCFFDSPHIYRDLIFPDFYEWITYTLDVLSKNTNLNILVKPHPNGIEGNDQVFAELKKRYPNPKITFIDKKTSNRQLIESHPRAVITAYGTAGSEFSYYGIPVICVYDNPFTAYNFTLVGNTVKQYHDLLNAVNEIKPAIQKEEILEYYYMQHIYFMNGRDNDYLKFAKYKGDTYSDRFLKDYLPFMTDSYFEMLDLSVKDSFQSVC